MKQTAENKAQISLKSFILFIGFKSNVFLCWLINFPHFDVLERAIFMFKQGSFLSVLVSN